MLHEQTEERKPTKLKTYTVRLDYEDCRFLTIRAASEVGTRGLSSAMSPASDGTAARPSMPGPWLTAVNVPAS